MKLKLFCLALLAVICARADIAISPSSIDYAVGGGGAAVKTSGSGTWTATTDVDWITLVKSSGDAGGSCTYIVSRNNSADVREGHITISGNIYTVTQKGCPITLTPSNISVDKAGSSGKITASVDAGVTWTATPSDAWITITPAAGSGAAELSYTVAEYNVVGSRIGTIRIGSEKFSVTQTGIDVTLSPVSTNITKDVCIVPLQVVALTDTKWTVTPNASWISVLDGGNGYGGSQVTLAVAENPSFEKRVGTVAIGTAVFTVTQSGTDDVNFKILPEVATASPKGAFANVAVYATPDASWTAESMDSWIKITEGESGAGNGNVKYVTMSNPELEPRTGHIKFTPPIYTPDLDLYSGLLFWIKEQENIEGNERRQTTYPLSKEFDGTFKNQLSGANIPSLAGSGYAIAFSFKVSEADRLNRLFCLGGNRNLFIDSNNKLCMAIKDIVAGWPVDETAVAISPNAWYTIVINQDTSDRMSIFCGEKDSQLSLVCTRTDSVDMTFGQNAFSPACLTFGYTDGPSSGYLQGGQISNLRFWSRTLTEIECQQIDLKQDVMRDNSPSGNLKNVDYLYFPLNGNQLCTSSRKSICTHNLCSASNVIMTNGRNRVRCNAVQLCHNGQVKVMRFGDVFVGDYVLNKGNELSDSHCWYSIWDLYYKGYPYPVESLSGSEMDVTYNIWVRIDSCSQNGDGFYVKRERTPCTNGNNVVVDTNGTFQVHIDSNKKLYIHDVVGEKEVGIVPYEPGKWFMLTISSRGGKSITCYVDGTEIGNINTHLVLGYLPPVIDKRYYYTTGGYGSTIYQDGNVEPISDQLTIGGWIGAIDEITFYNKALASKDIKTIYDSGLSHLDVVHVVNQGVQDPTVSPDVIEVSKFGVITNVLLSVARTINWNASANREWINIMGNNSGTGPASITVKVNQNTTCMPRSGIATIGTKTVLINQAALDCSITANKTVFPTEADETGGMGVISVSPEGNGMWTVESDVSWIYCYPESGTGSCDVYFFVEDMGSTAACRSGKITIGGQTIEITQRGYELSIDPNIGEVGGNAGAGVIGVAADDGAIWTAIADAPWISIVKTTKGYVYYTFTDNTTGKTRIGHINISGSTYTLTQTCKLDLNTIVEGKGIITGGGKYAQGANVTLTATPAAGYEFSHWSGDVVGVDAQTSVIMDSVKNVTATFIPESAAQVLAEKKAAQGGFYTRDQIHNLEMGNLVLDVDATTGKARIGVQLQETSDLSNPNWQPVNVSAGDLDVGADGTVGIKATATGNAKFFRVVTPGK